MELDDRNIVLGPPHRSWLGNHLRGARNAIGALGMALLTGGQAWRVAPFQVEYPQIDMPLRGLPPSLEGFRIIQFTDLHTQYRTPLWFLRQVVHRINELNPDMVVVTGDLLTHTRPMIAAAVELVAALRGQVVVTFGNHDYTRSYKAWTASDVADELESQLTKRGVTVLRNRSISIDRPDGRLWIVGLEDLWSGKFSPEAALAGIDPHEPVIALSHNPDTVYALARHGVQWVLAGHTHGGQIRVPVAGPLVLPVVHKEFAMGEFQVGNTRLYVSRGVGFRVRIRFRCRPEVACFRLSRVR